MGVQVDLYLPIFILNILTLYMFVYKQVKPHAIDAILLYDAMYPYLQ